MPHKFTLEEHEERMRSILKPPSAGGQAIQRLRDAIQRKRKPR